MIDTSIEHFNDLILPSTFDIRAEKSKKIDRNLKCDCAFFCSPSRALNPRRQTNQRETCAPTKKKTIANSISKRALNFSKFRRSESPEKLEPAELLRWRYIGVCEKKVSEKDREGEEKNIQ